MRSRTLLPAFLLVALPLLGIVALAPAASAEEIDPVCASTPWLAQNRWTVCVAPESDVCPVYYRHQTQWLHDGHCFPPQTG